MSNSSGICKDGGEVSNEEDTTWVRSSFGELFSLQLVSAGVQALHGQQGAQQPPALLLELLHPSAPPRQQPFPSRRSSPLSSQTRTCRGRGAASYRPRQQQLTENWSLEGENGENKNMAVLLFQVGLILRRHWGAACFLRLLVRRCLLPPWKADLDFMSLWTVKMRLFFQSSTVCETTSFSTRRQ